MDFCVHLEHEVQCILEPSSYNVEQTHCQQPENLGNSDSKVRIDQQLIQH